MKDSSKKRLLVLIFLLTFLLIFLFFFPRHFFNLTGFSIFSSGSGTLEDPYLIENCSQLQAMNLNLSAHYALANDIDCSDTINWNNGKGFVPIGNSSDTFRGSLDGKNHTISGLHINRSSTDYVGLFGFIDEDGEIKNVGLVNAVISGNNYVGSLAAYSFGSISNSSSICNVSGISFVGGLIGVNVGNISNSSSICNVSGISYVGGFVGPTIGSISNSYFVGRVSGMWVSGGLAGYNEGNISDSYSLGNVSGMWVSGGLVGYSSKGNILNSFYNYEKVFINNKSYIITIGALSDDFFNEWLNNNKNLFANDYFSKEGDYYLISNITDFKNLLLFGQNYSLKFKLVNNINLVDEKDFFIPYFAGEFDGNNKTFSNFNINLSSFFVGLFGYVSSFGKIKNVGVVGGNVSGLWGIGGLIGYNGGKIYNSYSTLDVRGESAVGGLAGYNFGSIYSSYNIGNVSASADIIGGFVGYNEGNISDSYSLGNVLGRYYIGGFIGVNYGSVFNSYSIYNVSGDYDVGGLIGENYGNISNSFSTGNVSGTDFVGGLIGENYGNISNSYFLGNVLGDNRVGSLVGFKRGYTSILNSYAITNIGFSCNSYECQKDNMTSDVNCFLENYSLMFNNFNLSFNNSNLSFVNSNISFFNTSISFLNSNISYFNTSLYLTNSQLFLDSSLIKNSNFSLNSINTTLFLQLINSTIKYNLTGTKITFFEENIGEISFLENVTAQGEKLEKIYEIKLNSNFNIYAPSPSSFDGTAVFAGVNLSKDLNFNKSANITFYLKDWKIRNGSILRNGQICNMTTNPSCFNYTRLDGGIVKFNISSWSEYSINGSFVKSCGNGILEEEMGEICDSNNFGGKNCSNFGNFTGGNLLCSADCTVIDLSSCSYSTPSTGGGNSSNSTERRRNESNNRNNFSSNRTTSSSQEGGKNTLLTNTTTKDKDKDGYDLTIIIIVGISFLVGIVILVLVIIFLGNKDEKEISSKFLSNEENASKISRLDENLKDETTKRNSPPISSDSSTNLVLVEVNKILDECTAAYMNKEYEKAKELYNNAKEIYEKNRLNDKKTLNRFFSLFDVLWRI